MKTIISTAAFLVFASTVQAQALYTLGGKTYEVKDLSPAQQQQMYEIQFESYEKSKQAIDGLVLETYLEEEAKKQNKSKEDVANKIFEVKDPNDKDVKRWYDENKSRIPPNYQFEQIKGEISKIVKQERMKAKRDEVLEKVKKDRKFAIALTKPAAPSVVVKTEGFAAKGKDSAKVTVVEFADYQCPHCKAAVDSFKKITEKMKDKVRFVYIDFPINPSGISRAVAEASHCAAEQGKYWEFHYKAFEGQATLDKDSPTKLAKELKLDEAKFKACVDAGKGKAVVEKGRAEGERVGVSGTPYIVINNQRYMGGHTVEALTKEIESHL